MNLLIRSSSSFLSSLPHTIALFHFCFCCLLYAPTETLQLVRRVPTVWTPVSGAAAEFTTSLAFSVPVQEILYKPGVAETLKFAWVQYLSLLLLLYFFADYARAYVYRYQLVDTYVASDTRPPQKVHQF